MVLLLCVIKQLSPNEFLQQFEQFGGLFEEVSTFGYSYRSLSNNGSCTEGSLGVFGDALLHPYLHGLL